MWLGGGVMRLAALAVAYKEERFIPKYIQSLQDRVDEILVLNSVKPWHGERAKDDKTAKIAESLGVTVIQYSWDSEEEQRNWGLDFLQDYDWVLVLDPDEYLTEDQWLTLYDWLEKGGGPADAYVCSQQNTYWKNGFIIDPPEDYKQIIAVKPHVRFVDKRVVNCGWAHAPVVLEHFSWARTDEEVWDKITHYGHANEFDTEKWFNEVWKSDRTEDLHPLTPPALKKAIRVQLPEELEKLQLWPNLKKI